mgnify:CR=1 FL=1
MLLLLVCWRTYKKSLIFGAIIKILSDLSSLIGPLSIGLILDDISRQQQQQQQTLQPNSTESEWKALFIRNNNENSFDMQIEFLHTKTFISNAYVLAVIVLFATFLQSTLSNNFNHLVISEGIRLKSALSVSLFN